MERYVTNIHFELNDRARLVRIAGVLFGIVAMGSIVFAFLGYMLPAMNLASDPMRGDHAVNAHAPKAFITTPVSSDGTPTKPKQAFARSLLTTR